MFIAQRTSSYEKTDYEVVKADSAVDLELRFLPLHPANSRVTPPTGARLVSRLRQDYGGL